ERPTDDLDALRRVLFCQLVIRILNLLSQTRLPRPALAHDQQLRLIQMIYALGLNLPEVLFDCLDAFLRDLRWGNFKGVLTQPESVQVCKLQNLRGNFLDAIAVELNYLQPI